MTDFEEAETRVVSAKSAFDLKEAPLTSGLLFHRPMGKI